MKITRDLDNYKTNVPVALTQGTFDGVHLGHRRILDQLMTAAQKINGKSVLLTFHPHPRLVLYPSYKDLKMILTLEEKIDILSEIGIDELVIAPFTRAFSRQSAEEFVKNTLVDKLGVSQLIVGYDHRFGKNREGSKEELNRLSTQYNFTIEEIPAQYLDEVAISSTKIRNALANGDISTANAYLSRNYSLQGKVKEGKKLGRKLGYPTANIDLGNKHKLVPKNGVYAVKARVGNDTNLYSGMMNIGEIPSIEEKDWSIEVHLFDFNQSIYGETIKIELIKRMRSEKKFATLNDLSTQLSKDKIVALELLQ